MPKHKDLKRNVRARMQKTGESYTTARLRLLDKKRTDSPKAAPKVDLAALAGMSEAAVLAGTGKSWSEWTTLLDAIDAASKPHREIARYVREQHGTSSWWSQGVTVGYERIRGLREKGQLRGGGYEATKSKTFGVPLARLYAASAEARQRKRWLGGGRSRPCAARGRRSTCASIGKTGRPSSSCSRRGPKLVATSRSSTRSSRRRATRRASRTTGPSASQRSPTC